MLLYEQEAEHRDDLADVVWFISADADYEIVFSYDVDAKELWDEINDPVNMPIAFPATLEIARYIIESKGHTIS